MLTSSQKSLFFLSSLALHEPKSDDIKTKKHEQLLCVKNYGCFFEMCNKRKATNCLSTQVNTACISSVMVLTECMVYSYYFTKIFFIHKTIFN